MRMNKGEDEWMTNVSWLTWSGLLLEMVQLQCKL